MMYKWQLAQYLTSIIDVTLPQLNKRYVTPYQRLTVKLGITCGENEVLANMTNTPDKPKDPTTKRTLQLYSKEELNNIENTIRIIAT